MIGLLHKPTRVPGPRSGATLTEVLMSILIMSIGVTSVFTLFPISIVRSIKATQQTNAALFKQNITELLHLRPELLYQHAPPTPSASGRIAGTAWQTGVPYSINTGVLSDNDVVSAKTSSGLVPQLYILEGLLSPGPADARVPSPFTSSFETPYWQIPKKWPLPYSAGGGAINIDPVTGQPYRVVIQEPLIPGDTSQTRFVWLPMPGHQTNPSANGYVVDPLGFWEIFDSNGALAAAEFGKRVEKDGVVPASTPTGNLSDPLWGGGSGVPGWGPGNISTLPRINCGLRVAATATTPDVSSSIASARTFFGLPDTWAANNSAAVIATNSVGVSATIPPNTFDFELPKNFNEIPASGTGSRIVLTTEAGQSYATANYAVIQTSPTPIVRATTPSAFIDVSGGAPGVPRVTQVRFESQETRYTWLATVNNSKPGTSKVTVAILFNRKYTLGEEHVYKSVWGNANTYYGASGTGQGMPWSDTPDYNSVHPSLGAGTTSTLQANQVVLAWDSLLEPTPVIADGDYVFDAVNVDWYKVADVSASGGAGSNKYFILTLDQPVRAPTLDTDGSLPQAGVGRLILFRGVAGLFEL